MASQCTKGGSGWKYFSSKSSDAEGMVESPSLGVFQNRGDAVLAVMAPRAVL